MPKFEKLSKLHKYSAAVSFLAMEIFALVAFSFGNNFVLYGALSLVLLLLLVLFNIKEITVDGVSSIALFFLPLFLFTVITALGVYMRSHAYAGHFSNAELVFIPLGLLPMSFAGYVLSIDKTFKISTFLVVVYAALGVLSLINLIVNLVNFGPFYSLIYKNYYMYYGGTISEVAVGDMAYVLEGFKFIEVRMERYLLFPTLLLTSSIALFFVSPKEKKLFITYCGFSLVGLLALAFVPSLKALLAFVVILVIDAIIFLLKKFEVLRKPAKYVLIVGVALVALLALAIILNNQTPLGIHNLTAGNALLNRIFNTNRYISKINPLTYNILCSDNFLGFAVDKSDTSLILDPANPVYPELHMSNCFYFDTFMTSGVIGVLAIVFALFIGLKGFKKYFLSEKDQFYSKAVLVALVVFYLIYIGLFNNTEYGVFYSIYQPVFISGPFMIMVFVLSYVLAKSHEVKPEVKEEQPVSETNAEVNINE